MDLIKVDDNNLKQVITKEVLIPKEMVENSLASAKEQVTKYEDMLKLFD